MEEIKIKILNNEIKLDSRCTGCNVDIWKDDNGVCIRCQGTGYEPTVLGYGLIKFFKRHCIKQGE